MSIYFNPTRKGLDNIHFGLHNTVFTLNRLKLDYIMLWPCPPQARPRGLPATLLGGEAVSDKTVTSKNVYVTEERYHVSGELVERKWQEH